jgi:hypothetical protein
MVALLEERGFVYGGKPLFGVIGESEDNLRSCQAKKTGPFPLLFFSFHTARVFMEFAVPSLRYEVPPVLEEPRMSGNAIQPRDISVFYKRTGYRASAGMTTIDEFVKNKPFK